MSHHSVIIDGTHSTEHDIDVSVPQGSCASANISNLYCSPLGDITPKDLQLSGFADDHSVCKTFKSSSQSEERSTMSQIEECMLKIKSWVNETRLKINPSKTEFIYFGSRQQHAKCTLDTIYVAGDLIVRCHLIKYLGVRIDSKVNFKHHVTKKCQCAMMNFKRIQSIRHLLNNKTTESLCLSLCVSHLDYCNTVLCGLPMVTLNKLQKVQNMCAHLVLRKHTRDCATDYLRALHWLPIRQCIAYKIMVLTFKSVHKIGPQYLQNLITPYQLLQDKRLNPPLKYLNIWHVCASLKVRLKMV